MTPLYLAGAQRCLTKKKPMAPCGGCRLFSLATGSANGGEVQVSCWLQRERTELNFLRGIAKWVSAAHFVSPR
nr:MAG TPA: hypothetical protein [Inoviridae sp.]